MQLFNKDERFRTLLLDHSIHTLDVELFLKTDPSTFSLDAYLANCFEVSDNWLQGVSEQVTEDISNQGSLNAFFDCLVQAKRSGFKPKIVLIKPEGNNTSEKNVMVLIELLKITKTGIAFTTYKQWGIDVWEEAVALCQASGIYYRGLTVDRSHYQSLCKRTLLPILAVKAAIQLWFPDVKQESIKTKSELSDTLRYIGVQPTILNSMNS